MLRKLPACALLGAALMLALTVVAPLAAADHTYSHRYILYGRVVDADGNPVEGVTVNMAAADRFFRPENQCQVATGSDLSTDAWGPTVYSPTTDARGDFRFCFHVHQMNRVEPGAGLLRVEGVENFEPVEIRFDPYFRSQLVILELPTTHERANPEALESSYTVYGRLWREASGNDVTVDGIKVFGQTVDQAPVDIKLLDPAGNVVAEHSTTTNDYGDFAVHVPTDARFSEGTVVISAAGREFREPASRAGITGFAADFPPEGGSGLMTALWVGAGLAAAAVVVGGGYWGIQKMSAAREYEQARSSSTRKRAKR